MVRFGELHYTGLSTAVSPLNPLPTNPHYPGSITSPPPCFCNIYPAPPAGPRCTKDTSLACPNSIWNSALRNWLNIAGGRASCRENIDTVFTLHWPYLQCLTASSGAEQSNEGNYMADELVWPATSAVSRMKAYRSDPSFPGPPYWLGVHCILGIQGADTAALLSSHRGGCAGDKNRRGKKSPHHRTRHIR